MVLASFPQQIKDLLSPVLSSPRLTDVVFLVGLFALTSSAISVATSAVGAVYNAVVRKGRKLSR